MKVNLKTVYWFHSHSCPMSTLGFRAGKLAKKLLRLRRSDYRVAVARLYFRSCAIDGVQLAFPSTYGNGNLIVSDDKEMKFQFERHDKKRKLILTFTDKVFEHMNRYINLRNEYEKTKNRKMADEVKKAYNEFLRFVQKSEDSELFNVEIYD